MKERPILFTGEMVRAILEDRKTKTRRVVIPQSAVLTDGLARQLGVRPPQDQNCAVIPCPHGVPGDRLWVRETCRGEELDNGLDGVRYRADDEFIPIQNTSSASIDWLKLHTYRGHHGAPAGPWVPSIHMPRWASRITLEITDVRVERLNDISEADAEVEGADPIHFDHVSAADRGLIDLPLMETGHPYRNGYALLWEQLNGPGSWAANPWVWDIEFRRVKS